MRELDEDGRALEELRSQLTRMRRHVDERRRELELIGELVEIADRRLAELQDDVARERTSAGTLAEKVRAVAARYGVDLSDG